MDRIVILGNGFDLAHELETSYNHFIKYVINESINSNDEIRKDLIDPSYLNDEDCTYEAIKSKLNQLSSASEKPSSGRLFFKNKFFRALLTTYFHADWINIEDYYFRYLQNISDINVLNSEFELVKKHLEKYLLIQMKEFDKKNYNSKLIDIFDMDSPENILFINFNYTSTLNLYLDKITYPSNITVINIHGELNSEKNPIVFGYGDDTNPKYLDLVNKKNNHYLRNLKRQQYNLTVEYDKMKEIMSNMNNEIEVLTMGHSLGLSDKTLLKEIFDHNKVSKIKFIYHEGISGYRNLNDNISRIVNRNTLNNKIVNFPNSIKMPQQPIKAG